MFKFFIAAFFLGNLCWPKSPAQTQIIAEAEKLYQNQIPKLKIEIKKDSIAFASAESDGITGTVIITSGLINSARLTDDGFRITLCHELGHIYGGAPRRNIPYDWQGPIASDGYSFHSSEGQSDYYASSVCFKKLIAGQDHLAVLRNQTITNFLKTSCSHLKAEQIQICYRSALAATNFLTHNVARPISIETSDQSISPYLLRDQYPSRQCRLDTFFAGARCPKEIPILADFIHPENNDCKDPTFARPACWYK
jgi:hypothetical protein